jgi:ADP-ribosyl-[dinitrogen reductase] hydrolase
MSPAKTSHSHPLNIASVSIRDGQGVIGLTFCPVKKHTGMISGEWDRDLGIDIQAIDDFGASALVTLMEAAELEAVQVGCEHIRSETRTHGIEWHHLPIVVPEAT